jgi:hypothetical protein
MECNYFTGKDWLYLCGLILTFLIFWYRLRVDTKFATYRETLSYLEKKSDGLKKAWGNIRAGNSNDDEIIHFFGELDQIALLVLRKGFDNELVYNYCWDYYYLPLNLPEVKRVFNGERRTDKTVCQNYLKLSSQWSDRILKEEGYS